jgi:hypothetical protein
MCLETAIMLEAADAPARAGQKKVRVRFAYDQFGIWALLALHTVPRMCNLRILKGVEKFDSRRLHQPLVPTRSSKTTIAPEPLYLQAGVVRVGI